MRKLILAILGVVLLVASIFIAKLIIDSKNKTRPAPKKVIKTVFVEHIENDVVPIIISANGNLTAKRKLEIYSEVQGIFQPKSKLFRAGQKYNKGEPFIHIDNTEYFASVKSAKSNFYNSIAAMMADLRLDYPIAYEKWQDYLQNFDLDKPILNLPKMGSEKETFFITGKGIVSSYYNVKNLEQRLSKYTIAAPFKGILVEALVKEGTLVRNNQKLGEFIDPTVYEMEVAISKSYADLLEVGKKVKLNNLEKTKSYDGVVSRVNGKIDAVTQTISAFIEVKNNSLKEGMYLEANLNAKQENDAIEINRSLLIDNKKLFIVKDSVLDVIDVNPVYFSDETVVIKNIPNETIILSRPVPGAYVGMLVKPLTSSNQ